MSTDALWSLAQDFRAQKLLAEDPYQDRRVAIVGARDADQYGLQIAYLIGQTAAQAGALVLSGGARGIDMQAHLGALDEGGASVAILGCGLERAPRRLQALRQQGLGLMSPFQAYDAGLKWRYVKRNECIAESANALIVVQALETSGSLISARHALRLGHPVWVCPGPLGAPHSGCYALLKEGARLLQSHEDWIQSIAQVQSDGSQARSKMKTIQVPQTISRAEPAPSSILYQVAGSEPKTIAELAVLAQMSLPLALSEATLLELSGWFTATPLGTFVRVEGSC